MDCAEIRRAFVAGAVPSGAALREHLNECARCRELFGGDELGCRLARAGLVPPSNVSEQLHATESLIAGEHGLRAFLRSRSTRVRWASCLVLSAALLVRELLSGHVPVRELGATRVLAVLLSFALLGLVARYALRPWPIAPSAARRRTLFAWLAWGLPCVLWFTPEARAGADDYTSTDFALRSLSCFGYGSALCAPSFALLWAFGRAESTPGWMWRLAAGWVALLSTAILLLHCPSAQRAHLMAGHFSIGLSWFMAVSVVSWWRRDDR